MTEQQKHDGKLDEYSDDRHVMVELEPKGTPRGMFGLPSDVPMVHVDGGYGGIEMEDIILDPKQALSLLAWLEQEKEKLELLAKEQDEHI